MASTESSLLISVLDHIWLSVVIILRRLVVAYHPIQMAVILLVADVVGMVGFVDKELLSSSCGRVGRAPPI